ncbi:MAG: tetratricopeptide repeat protein [Pirellulaceae bacterium]|nr:tetratricopeptide repeat protein [Pirellulaceae bacterium]
MTEFRSRFKVGNFLLGVIFFGAGQGVWTGCRTLSGTLPDGRLVRARQLSLRGADLLRRSRYDDAQTLFNEAIQNCPNDERAHWGYATTLWENNQRGAAIAHMTEAVRLSGSNPEFMTRLGEMYLAENDLARAKSQADLVLQSHRDRADAWALLGDSYAQSNQPAEAIESYHRALLLQSDYPRVQLATAIMYRQIGRPNRSLATLDRMVDMHPSDCAKGEAQLIRALALTDLNRKDEALLALKSATDGLPENNPQRHIELAYAQYQLGELVEARMSLGRLLQQHPDYQGVKELQIKLDSSFAYLAEQPSHAQLKR